MNILGQKIKIPKISSVNTPGVNIGFAIQDQLTDSFHSNGMTPWELMEFIITDRIYDYVQKVEL